MMEWVPVRNADWEHSSDGSVTLRKPKSGNWLINLIIRKTGVSPTCRIRLDAYGSAVWEWCDGKRTAFEIAEQLRRRFREIEDTVYDRVGQFLGDLARHQCITFRDL
ncbi:MAG TPA: PqqD family protein [bacterium]|nr:PqqD family protein [bacterium]